MFSARHRSNRISAEQVRPVDRPVVIGAESSGEAFPQVDLLPVSEEVTEIHVTCRCGEQIILSCAAPSVAGKST